MSLNITSSKWWKARCMQLDIIEYMSGDLDKKTFLEYMRLDLEELKKLLDEEEKEL